MGAYADLAASLPLVIVGAIEHTAGQKVGVELEFPAFQVFDGCIAEFAEIVRQDLGSQANGDPFRPLGQQQRSAGLDASGLASLLTAQKGQIAAAIPSGLADRLSAAGLIDKAEESLRSGAATASAAGSRIAGAGQTAYARTSSAASQWPYWLVALAIVGGLAWYALGRHESETVAEAPRPATSRPATGTVGLAPTDLTVGGVNLANQVNSSVGALRSVLPGITDVASAQAALPKLHEATAQLNEVGNLATKLSPEGKSALAKLIAAARPSIDQMCEKVLAAPGVGGIAKPAIDELRGKLDTLSRA